MFKVLEILEITTHNIGSLISVFISGYSESYRKLRNLQPTHNTSLTDKLRDYLKEKHNFHSLLCRLKKDGLIREANSGGRVFAITEKGKDKLNNLKLRKQSALPRGIYDLSNSEEIKIVIFDIPEKDRKKRHWLRAVLKRLNFKMIQKSVWLGKVNIPEEFISDLKKLRLLEYVEIFAITKKGSLKRI